MQPVPCAGNMQPLQSAGKSASGAKRGKLTCNRCQARENERKRSFDWLVESQVCLKDKKGFVFVLGHRPPRFHFGNVVLNAVHVRYLEHSRGSPGNLSRVNSIQGKRVPVRDTVGSSWSLLFC